ncbi:aryl-phospho-beta-D-glucosidase BglC (GH1 family) [Thermocatellispora tengchongensis]|uniref:Aryl-phospho-beta-D-glucosidase BglC (GH1 family) n=1 Tax=Thermocatellispora tengchongensis TaxID=1073253 RepID=A0A840P4Z3_9ACTN|nr:cellulase family glycosylhydrolase [Thermocatellispora tengchongensis]MBB5131105.1 aryl-phospho-beta-D-glucosidase BglC (GH1 family) [Thermocatellispora tengchongensis]
MLDNQVALRVSGSRLVNGAGEPVRLRGVGLGGWMNMENFITGYPANETTMRAAVRDVLGEERYELFFERLLTSFFGEEDADLLAAVGANCVRIPVNYRRFESDERPMEIVQDGFRHLDRVIDLLASRGIYSVIDLHALPGSQNQHWHSDNPTHIAALWRHRGFQDRVVNLWEAIATHYRDNPWVAGYNPVNEPGDDTGKVIGPFYDRLVKAIRGADPSHVLFLDGNTYSTDFSVFRELYPNTVFVCHDYALAGFAHGGPYPGYTRGEWCDRAQLESEFERRTRFQRETGTPLWVGEFGPVYTGDPAVDAQRYQILTDQLEIYDEHEAGWSLWTYKDVGLQGLVYADSDGAYLRRFGDFIAKKGRLGADRWGSTMEEAADVLAPLYDLMEREFPNWNPYPWGARYQIDDLIRHVLIAQALVPEYAELFRGLGDEDLIALADSFALRNCARREPLLDLLTRNLHA